MFQMVNKIILMSRAKLQFSQIQDIVIHALLHEFLVLGFAPESVFTWHSRVIPGVIKMPDLIQLDGLGIFFQCAD